MNDRVEGILEALIWADRTIEKGIVLKQSPKEIKAEIEAVLDELQTTLAA